MYRLGLEYLAWSVPKCARPSLGRDILPILNEHAQYKRGVVRPEMSFAKIFNLTKWLVKNVK